MGRDERQADAFVRKKEGAQPDEATKNKLCDWLGPRRSPGASMNFYEGQSYSCVRLCQLPVVQVDDDTPRVSAALAALLEQMRHQAL